MKWTLEQTAIIDAKRNLQTRSVAGSGLTETLIAFAKNHRDQRILYVTCTKKDRQTLSKKFKEEGMDNIKVETPCSLARKKLGIKSIYVRSYPFAPYEIVQLLRIKSSDTVKDLRIAHLCGKLLQHFCHSPLPSLKQTRFEKTLYQNGELAFFWKHKAAITGYAQQIITLMQRLEIPILPSFCVKLYEQVKPRLHKDIIIVDDAHHINPCFAAVLNKQAAVKVICGDVNLHQFQGGHVGNLLYHCHYPIKTLSTSFIYNQDIADQTRKVLGMKKLLYENFEAPIIHGTDLSPEIRTLAVIGKQRHTVLSSAMILMTHHKNLGKLYFEGGFKKYLSTDDGVSIYDILFLYIGERSRIQHPFISSFASIEQLEEYAIAVDAEEYLGMIEIVKKHRRGLPDLIRELKRNLIRRKDPKSMADVIYTSLPEAVHQSYDQVNLLDDFMMVQELQDQIINRQSVNYVGLEKEINQLYEACSKARVKLCLPDEFLPDITTESKIEYEPVELGVVDHFNLTGAESALDRQEIIYSLDRQKRAHQNTFSRWSNEDEHSLKELQSQSASVDDMAKQLNRTKSAVTMRLRKINGK